jgi:chromosome segregation ATPase
MSISAASLLNDSLSYDKKNVVFTIAEGLDGPSETETHCQELLTEIKNATDNFERLDQELGEAWNDISALNRDYEGVKAAFKAIMQIISFYNSAGIAIPDDINQDYNRKKEAYESFKEKNDAAALKAKSADNLLRDIARNTIETINTFIADCGELYPDKVAELKNVKGGLGNYLGLEALKDGWATLVEAVGNIASKLRELEKFLSIPARAGGGVMRPIPIIP